MTKTNSTRRNSHVYDNRDTTTGQSLVDAVSQEMMKSETQRRDHDRMVKRNQNGHLYDWLKQCEAQHGAAYPAMNDIRQAEKLCGRRLCIRINKALLLSSRGFRFVSENVPLQPHIFYMTGDVQKISKRRIKRRLNPNFSQQDIQKDVTYALTCINPRKNLLYMGVDEWPLLGRVVFSLMAAATGTLSSLMWAGPHFLLRHQDYELALSPVLTD